MTDGGKATIDLSGCAGRWTRERTRGSAAQLSTFIGRKRELDELEDLFGESRLVTLTGPGGSGKTRLALELATRLAERYRDGFAFVDLAPITDPDLVAAAIAVTLRVRADPQRPLLDMLAEELQDRELLLMLDNLEQLPDASIVATLLVRCPALSILATSRTALHLRGEQQFPVDPMALPLDSDLTSTGRLAQNEAVALFVDRARSIDPHFELTTTNCGSVAAICTRLDGLPLAIELAAARSGLLAPAALLRRLEHSLSVLTSGAVDAPARQRTLRDTIAWSYELLDDEDRVVFARLSIFVAGFDLSAAEDVLRDPAVDAALDVVGSLGRLVDQNLIRVAPDPEGEPRFRLLETVREFAFERVSGDEAKTLGARHARYFAGLVEQARRESGGRDHVLWINRLTQNLDNVRASLEWARVQGDALLLVRLAAAVSLLLIERGDPLEAGRWLHTAHAMASNVDPPLRAALMYQLAEYEILFEGDRAQVEEHFSQALRIYETARDYPGMARTLLYLANVAADLGDSATALARLERARSAAQSIRDPIDAARVAGDIAGQAPAVQGYIDPEVARSAIAIGTEVGYRPAVAIGWMALGMKALAAGEGDAATEALARALEIWAELGDRPNETQMLACLGIANLRAGDLDASRPLLVRAVQAARESPRYVGIWALDGSADWLGATGRAESAVACWAAADAARAASPDRTSVTAPEFFTPSRQRDRAALRPAAYEAAYAAGQAMTLRDALAYAIGALNDAGASSSGPRASPARRGRYDLTPREREVLELVVAGRSDGEIGEALYISKKTAAVHVGNIKGKLGATSRVDIAGIAVRHGLVPPSRQT